MSDSPLCEYGHTQTIKHIVEMYSLTKYEGGTEKNLLLQVRLFAQVCKIKTCSSTAEPK
jgi:hypothetical protein